MAACSTIAPAPAHPFTTTVISSDAAWRALKPDWDSLLAACPRPSPFLCWDWLHSWWQSFGAHSRLHVITVSTPAGVLAGAAPLHLVRRAIAGLPLRSLEFLGYRGSRVCADHLDFPALPALREPACAALVAAIYEHTAWDRLVLADLDSQSLLPALLRRSRPTRRSGWFAPAGRRPAPCLVPAETCFYLSLPPSVPELWRQLGTRHPQFSRNLRRYQRRLERHHHVRFVAPVPPQEIPAAFAALVHLHGLARRRHGQAGNFACPPYRDFHQRVIAGWAHDARLYLARLDCDGQIAAVLYGYVLGGVLYFYQSGFDTRLQSEGVGKLLLARVLEDAIARLGLEEFDFLRGTESYKRLWTGQARQTATLRLWRPGVAATLDHAVYRLRRHGRADGVA
ncbi:MAG: GNAT family N-acetyltransferase [Terriglobales bacterium]